MAALAVASTGNPASATNRAEATSHTLGSTSRSRSVRLPQPLGVG